MGTTWYSEARTKKEALELEFERMEIVAQSIKGNVAYLAVRSEKGYVFGAVSLFSRDSDGIGVKTMDESMGPYYFECPKKVFDALTPLDEIERLGGYVNDYSRGWRKSIEQNHARSKAAKLEEGMQIRFQEPVQFVDYSETDFTVRKYNRRFVFEAKCNGHYCRIPNYKHTPFEVVGSQGK